MKQDYIIKAIGLDFCHLNKMEGNLFNFSPYLMATFICHQVVELGIAFNFEGKKSYVFEENY